MRFSLMLLRNRDQDVVKSNRNEEKRREEVVIDYSCTNEHDKQTSEIIPALIHGIQSSLQSLTYLGKTSTMMGDLLIYPPITHLLYSTFVAIVTMRCN